MPAPVPLLSFGNGPGRSEKETSNGIDRTRHREQERRLQGSAQDASLTADIEIAPNEHKAHENQPDYRVLSSGIEVGAGWNRRSETTGRDYVSLSLAAPEFGPRRLYANLGRAAGGDDNSFALIWNPAD